MVDIEALLWLKLQKACQFLEVHARDIPIIVSVDTRQTRTTRSIIIGHPTMTIANTIRLNYVPSDPWRLSAATGAYFLLALPNAPERLLLATM